MTVDADYSAAIRAVERHGAILSGANEKRDAAMAELTTAVLEAAALGVPEARMARVAHVDRMTIRKMLGKR